MIIMENYFTWMVSSAQLQKHFNFRIFALLFGLFLFVSSYPLKTTAGESGNFYVGGFGGVNGSVGVFKNGTNVSLVSGGVPQTNVILTPNPNLQNISGLGAVFLGYDLGITPLVSLGFEGRALFFSGNTATNASIHETVGTFMVMTNQSIKQKDELDLLLRPSINIEDHSLYFLAGITRAKFDMQNTASFSLMPDPSFSLSSNLNSQAFHKRKTAGIFGIGLKQNIFGRLSIQLEYNYVDYENIFSSSGTSAPIVASPPSTDIIGSQTFSSYDVTVQNHRANLGLLYTFD